MEQTYQSSKGTFSISRYGQLKDMIKGASSDDTISNLQHIIQDTSSNGSGKYLSLWLETPFHYNPQGKGNLET